MTRSDALLKQAANTRATLMREAVQKIEAAPRRRFDITRTIEKILRLIAPIVPAATTLRLEGSAPVYVLANPKDVFRILFNLIHNAVVATRATATPRRIELAVAKGRHGHRRLPMTAPASRQTPERACSSARHRRAATAMACRSPVSLQSATAPSWTS